MTRDQNQMIGWLVLRKIVLHHSFTCFNTTNALTSTMSRVTGNNQVGKDLYKHLAKSNESNNLQNRRISGQGIFDWSKIVLLIPFLHKTVVGHIIQRKITQKSCTTSVIHEMLVHTVCTDFYEASFKWLSAHEEYVHFKECYIDRRLCKIFVTICVLLSEDNWEKRQNLIQVGKFFCLYHWKLYIY